MTMKEVCKKYSISPDTLRYYERVGVIPAVHRTKNNVRDYTEQDIGCVENAICMRNAGVPVEMVAKYVELCQQGDETFLARRDLLREVREGIVRQIEKCQRELERLEYKIARYENAVETGELVWDRAFSLEPETEKKED
ncbi:MAG: MerR family transcriptional regulator [Lachnospiraceae bacterium]|nr:MerR family transcriptional regulator [Lachnospiraceae bacterium]